MIEEKLSQKEFKVHPLDYFSIDFQYTFNGKEEKYEGIKAYEFLEKIIKFDKEYSEKRIREEVGYLKYYIWMTINLKGYSTEKMRIDLGDKEFGGYAKVSDALEYKLKEFPQKLLENKKFFVKYVKIFKENPDELEKTAKEMLEKIEKGISHFREKEEIYLNKREKMHSEKQLNEEIVKLIKNKKVKDKGIER